MKTFAEIQSACDSLALALLAYIDSRVPCDGSARPFRVDFLRLDHPHEEGVGVRLHSLRRITGEVCALGEIAEDGAAGEELEPLPVAGFLLDALHSIAAQLPD